MTCLHAKNPPLIDPAIWTDDEKAANAIEVVAKLQKEGFTAYFAGGCVRDALLGKPPKDFDVATDAVPDRVRQIFGRRRTLAFGASFGVIGVLPDQSNQGGKTGGGPTEVATFRSDGTYTDGRRPDAVHFGTPEADAMRRDFTINGIFLDPISHEVIDYVGGHEDLARKRLQTIGDATERFGEDKLRMLRAVRFATTLGFDVAPETILAIQELGQQINVVSGERIGIEMRKTLAAKAAIDGLRLLDRTGLGRHVWPALVDLDMNQAEERLDARDGLSQRQVPPPMSESVLALGCLLQLLPDQESELRYLREAWKLSGEEVRALTASIRVAETLCRSQHASWSTLQPILTDRDIGTAIRVAACHATSIAGGSSGIERCVQELGRTPDDLDPPPLLTGKDLKELGHTPGPHFSSVLKQLRVLQLNGEMKDRQSALQWIGDQKL